MINFKYFKDEGPCPYYNENESESDVTWMNLVDPEKKAVSDTRFYDQLLELGFRRSGGVFYHENCRNCQECIPIRLSVEEFKPSKSQRAIYRKNQDLKIIIEKAPVYREENKAGEENKESKYSNFATEEKAWMYREYDAHHNHNNPDFKKMTINEARDLLEMINTSYSGNWNMCYYLGEKLVAVGIIDIATNDEGKISALSSNYFYYDVSPEVLKRSIGVYSVLKEIELCKEMNIPYYYLGLYLPNCSKMNYKTNYKPYELRLFDYWISSNDSEIQQDLLSELSLKK